MIFKIVVNMTRSMVYQVVVQLITNPKFDPVLESYFIYTESAYGSQRIIFTF